MDRAHPSFHGPPYRPPPPNQYGYHPPAAPASGYAMFPPESDMEIVQMFNRADVDGSRSIDEHELGRLLSARMAFPPRTLRLMLHLFADMRGCTTRIGLNGFTALWRELTVWHFKFKEYDRDRSGTIDKTELQQALFSLHFAIPSLVLDILVHKYDRSGFNRCISYGDFVECGLIVKGLTEQFRRYDPHQNGTATFDYQSFMLLVIPFIAA